jgi:Flp pilus assembly protein TadD
MKKLTLILIALTITFPAVYANEQRMKAPLEKEKQVKSKADLIYGVNALEKLSKRFAKNSKDEKLRIIYADALFLDGQYKKSLKILKPIFSKDQTPKYLQIYGKLHASLGEHAKAIRIRVSFFITLL